MSSHRYHGSITAGAAQALEAEGDVSYRVRVVRGSHEATVGEPAYATSLGSAERAVARVAKRWGKYAHGGWDYREAVEECDVIIEARERTYRDGGQVKRGVDSGRWSLLGKLTVAVATGEAVTA